MMTTRTLDIPIPQDNIYSVNSNIFDPANFSPPNEFLNKLKLRSLLYGNDGIFSEYTEYSQKKSEKVSKEWNTELKNNIHSSTTSSASQITFSLTPVKNLSIMTSLLLKKVDNLDKA